MTTPDMPPLPRVTRSMVFKHFGPNAGRDLLRTEWKDGIDLEVATYALQCFAEDYAAAAVLAERERLSSPEAVAEAAMLLGAFSADENASAKALFDAARTLFGAETVAAVLTKYKSKEQP